MGGMRATGPRPATLAPARGSFSSLPRSPFRPRFPQAAKRWTACGVRNPSRRMRPARIVQMHRLLHRPPRTLLGLKLEPQSIFALENAVDSFRQRVLRAVIGLRHAHAQPVFSHQIHILMRTILGSLIGMMDGLRSGWQPRQRRFQRRQAPGGRRGIAAVVPHHLARGLVGQQRQEHKPCFRPKVSDISHPNPRWVGSPSTP